MIPTSTATPSRFTPKTYDGQENPPVFLVKTPSYRDVIEFHKELTLAGARYPSDSEIGEALATGLADLGEGYQDFKEVVDRFSAGQELEPDEKFKLDFLTDALRNVEYVPLLQLMAMRDKYMTLSSYVAAQMFLLGWENLDKPFERKLNRVPESVLQTLSLQDVMAIGTHARLLMMPTADQTKN